MTSVVFAWPQANQANISTDAEPKEEDEAEDRAVRLQQLAISTVLGEERGDLAKASAEKADDLNRQQAEEIMKKAEEDLVSNG